MNVAKQANINTERKQMKNEKSVSISLYGETPADAVDAAEMAISRLNAGATSGAGSNGKSSFTFEVGGKEFNGHKFSVNAALQVAARTQDIDQAVKLVMDTIGIDTGDVAAQFFSGEKEKGWEGASYSDRYETLKEWLLFEIGLMDYEVGGSDTPAPEPVHESKPESRPALVLQVEGQPMTEEKAKLYKTAFFTSEATEMLKGLPDHPVRVAFHGMGINSIFQKPVPVFAVYKTMDSGSFVGYFYANALHHFAL